MLNKIKNKSKPIFSILLGIFIVLSSIGQNFIAYGEEEEVPSEQDSYKITLEDTENGTLVFKDDENTREKDFKDEEDFHIVFKADEGYTIDNIVLSYKNGDKNTLLPTDEYNDIRLKALTDYTIKANFKKVDETVKKRTKRSSDRGVVIDAFQMKYFNGESITWGFTVRANDGTILTATCIEPENQSIPLEGKAVRLSRVAPSSSLGRLAYIGSQNLPLSKTDYYVIGRAGAVLAGYPHGGYNYKSIVDNYISRARDTSLRVPSSFDAYIGVPIDNSQRMLAFAEAPPKGYIKVVKKSSLPSITDGNKCYSLEGARYEVRNSSGSWVDTIETDSNGVGYSSELDTGSYTVKEIKASKGYDLDTNRYRVSVTSDNSTKASAVVVNSLEHPKNDPSRIEITKIFNGLKTPTIPSLEGTQFTINYYDGYYTESNLPSSPTRSWILEVKKVGDRYITQLLKSYKVGGDNFYMDGVATVLPLGTISIQETKPAFGYTLDGYMVNKAGVKVSTRQKYVTQIVENASSAYIKAGNVYSGKNDPIYGSITINKVNENNRPLANVTFKLLDSRGNVVSEKTTNSSGIVKWDNLYPDRYTLVETKTAKGYQLLKEPIVIDVPSKFTEIQLNQAGISKASARLNNGKYGDNMYYVDNVSKKIVNTKSFKIPMTGGKGMNPLKVIGFSLFAVVVLSIVFVNYNRKK